MKTAISIPDELFQAADEFAAGAGLSRSELYCRAVRAYLEAHQQAAVTDKLNQVYASRSSALDPLLGQIQGASLVAEEW